MPKKLRADFIVVQGESRSESGLCFTLGWESLEALLKGAQRLGANEFIEKVRLESNGLDLHRPEARASEEIAAKDTGLLAQKHLPEPTREAQMLPWIHGIVVIIEPEDTTGMT